MRKTMKNPLGFAVLLALLIGVFAVGTAAEAAVPEIYPSEDVGAYVYSYSQGVPKASYVVYMLAGTYADSDTPTLSTALSNVLYYNHVRADESGKIDLSFVPMSYRDGTVFLASAQSQTPTLLFYAKAGDAKDLADFTLSLDAKEYILKGGNEVTYVRYSVKAVDSFGFTTTLPSFATREIVGYTGDKISFLSSGGVIALDPSLEEGTYTLSISCGDIVRTADIVVKHGTPTPAKMVVTVDGDSYSDYYFIAKTDTETTTIDPEYLHIEAKTLDQYGAPRADTYTYTYYPVYDGVSGKPQQLLGSDFVDFYPPQIPMLDETLYYTFTVSSSFTDPNSVRKQPFSFSFDITVRGGTSYSGLAEKLFTTYLSAKEYIERLDSEDILIAESSVNVPQTQKWCRQAAADSFREVFDRAEALLEAHKTEPQKDSVLSKMDSELTDALDKFKRNLYNGNFAMIQKLSFSSPTQVLPLGESQTFAVSATPARPSEKVIYTSENDEIATVDASGTVTAKSVGVTRITASNTIGSISAFYDLTVYRPISSVSFAEREITLVAGEKIKPEYTVLPEDHGDTLTFAAENTKVVWVDAETGELLALAEGTTTVNLTTSGRAKASLTVNVVAPVFSGSLSARAKPLSEIKLTYAVNDAYNFDKMRLTASYDAKIFTLKEAACQSFAASFVGTDTETAGKAISAWDFEKPMQTSSAASLVTYTFVTAEDASFGKHNISVVLEAQTENGSDIFINNFELTAVVTVGETNTYTVQAVASGGGTVSDGGEYALGETATLTATPNSNYTLSGWYVNNKLVYSGLVYSFTVTEDVTVTAKFAKKTPSTGGGGGGGGGGSTGGSTVTKLEQVKPVTCDTPSGEIQPGTKVTLSCATNGATIYYTLDGTPPTGASLRYTEPIEITQNGTQIRAVAIRNGMTNSEIVAFNFRFPVEETKDPEEKPDDGDKPTESTAVIALKADAAQIRYLVPTSSYIRPNDPASRYEVVEMLAKLFDISNVTAGNRFADVSESYKTTVELLAAAGVINGYEDGTFGGIKEITRAELVKILSVLLGLDKTAVDGENAVSLSDISGHWAENLIRKFVAKGYIVGYPEGDFRPDKAVSRAEAVTIINRVTGVVKTSGLPSRFRDLNTEHWAYDDIMNVVAE